MRVIIHFYPRKSRLNDDGQLPSYLRFTVKSRIVDLSTGLFIQSKHWSEAKGRVKDRHIFNATNTTEVCSSHLCNKFFLRIIFKCCFPMKIFISLKV